MPLTLPPAQNATPAPVIRSAPTSGFSPQVLIAAGLDHGAQCRGQCVRHRVADFGPVERDDRDAVADYTEQFAGAGVDFGGRHVGFPHMPSAPSLREQSDEAIQLFFARHGLLRFARNDGN